MSSATKAFPDGRHDFVESMGSWMNERVGWVREADVPCFTGLDLYIHFGRATLTDDVEGAVVQSGPTVGLRKPQLPRPSTTQVR